MSASEGRDRRANRFLAVTQGVGVPALSGSDVPVRSAEAGNRYPSRYPLLVWENVGECGGVRRRRAGDAWGRTELGGSAVRVVRCWCVRPSAATYLRCPAVGDARRGPGRDLGRAARRAGRHPRGGGRRRRQVAGCAHLRIAFVSPLHAERAVHVSHLQVAEHAERPASAPACSRRPFGWAEHEGVSVAARRPAAADRDTNRFLARLGLAQVAVLRATTVAALRARLPARGHHRRSARPARGTSPQRRPGRRPPPLAAALRAGDVSL